MKTIIYLPLLTSALLLGWYFFTDSTSVSPPATPPPATVQQPLTTGASAPPGKASNMATSPSLPASVRGTEVDGQLEVDERGNLLITDQLRHLFDYFLNLIGEESPAASQQRIREHLARQLPQPALAQALALLDNYIDYRQQLGELESHFPRGAGLDDLLSREQAVQRLRATLFSREAHAAFFAGEEIYNSFTLERLAIQQDDSLDERQKALATEALRENLPESMQQLLVPQIHQDLRQQTLALREQGADEAAVRELRMQLLGPEATTRLEALDRNRAQWQQRLEQFNHEREAILQHPGLADDDKQQAIDSLLQEQFEPNERLRVSSLLDGL